MVQHMLSQQLRSTPGKQNTAELLAVANGGFTNIRDLSCSCVKHLADHWCQIDTAASRFKYRMVAQQQGIRFCARNTHVELTLDMLHEQLSCSAHTCCISGRVF